MALVSLINAKHNVQIPLDSHEDDLLLHQKIEQASVLILGRCGSTAHWREIAATWTETTVPADVQSAVFVVLTYLWRHRGDNMAPDAALWAAVDNLIAMKRDLVVA